MVKLPPDPSRWVDKIYEHIAQTHPYLTDHLQGGIDWSAKPIDEDKGDGTGHITALIGDQPIRIPVIVRDFKLKPVDLYINEEGEKDLIDKEIASRRFDPKHVQVGNSIDPTLQYDREGLYNDWMGKVGSYNRFSEDCERILPDLAEEYPGMKSGIEMIQKTAEKQKDPSEHDAIVFRKMGSGFRVTPFSAGEKVASHTVRRNKAYDNPDSMLAKAARRVDEKGSAILVNRELDKVALTAGDQGATVGDHPDEMKPGDTAEMLLENGEKAKGVMMPRVSLGDSMTEDGNLQMIFVAQGHEEEGAYSTSPSHLTKGEGAPLSRGQMDSIEDANRGDRGFIALPQPDDQAAGLTGPVRVLQVLVNTDGERVVRVESRLDGQARLVLSDKVDRIFEIEKERDDISPKQYLVPEDLKIVSAEKELNPAQSSAEEVLNEKTASSDDLGIASIAENRGDFLCRSEGTEETLMSKEAKGWLMSLGCKEESAHDLVKQAQEREGRITVYGLERPISKRRGQSHVSRETQEKVAQAVDVWTEKRDKINKFAEQLPGGSPMQSQMASMNMMNQYNAPKYADALKEIQEAKSSVADLLYQVRTGETDMIDSDVTKDALVALDAIIDGLKKVQATKS